MRAGVWKDGRWHGTLNDGEFACPYCGTVVEDIPRLEHEYDTDYGWHEGDCPTCERRVEIDYEPQEVVA